MLDKVLHIIDVINDWVLKIFGWLAFPMLAVLLFEIISRYVFNEPTVWVHQTAEFLFGGYFILLGGYVLRIGQHVKTDIFYNRFSERGRAIVDICTFVLFLLLCMSLIWWGGEMAARSWQDNEHSEHIWAAPLYPAKTAIPVGGFLLFMQGMAKFARDIKTVIGRKQEHAGN